MNFFGQPNTLKGLNHLNETGTDKEDQPTRLDFQLKLTRLVKGIVQTSIIIIYCPNMPLTAFRTSSDPPNPAKIYIHATAPPPELLFDHEIQPSVDIWDLAVIVGPHCRLISPTSPKTI